MFTPKRIKLTLAMVLVVSTLIALGLTLSIGHTAPAKPLRGKLLRRADRRDSKLDAKEIDFLRKHAQQEEKKEERIFENKIPQHLPIKVKLRAEKEKAAKDLENSRWPRDLELEIKNTGDKPIYYLSLILEMPEISDSNGALTLHMQYGEHTLFDGSGAQASPGDVPLNPKKTLILTFDDGQARGWDLWRAREKRPQPKKILILFEELNFGDGTGFFGGNGAPWPLPNRKRPPPEDSLHSKTYRNGFTNHHATTLPKKPIAWKWSGGGESASLWSTSFRLAAGLSLSTFLDNQEGSASEVEACCPSGCTFISILDYQFCYYCPVLRRASGVACIYEEDGICATVIPRGRVCSDGNSCPEDLTYPCGYVPPSPTPTPDTPTPTPTPTPPAPPCDPATKPNNSNCVCDTTPYLLDGSDPRWYCGLGCPGGVGADYAQYPGAIGYAGCAPDRHNNQNDCCICIFQFCPDGSSVNPNSCECPTPTPGGGGGGGGDSPPPEPCTSYWWVYYESYDGGQTWVEIDRWYAGCW